MGWGEKKHPEGRNCSPKHKLFQGTGRNLGRPDVEWGLGLKRQAGARSQRYFHATVFQPAVT